MAKSDWLEIYGAYTDAELAEEWEELKKEIRAARGLTAQGAGSRNFQRDLGELRDRLGAVTRVQNERQARGRPGGGTLGQVTFEDVSW